MTSTPDFGPDFRSASVSDGGSVVRAGRIALTDTVVFSAWEPYAGGPASHSALTSGSDYGAAGMLGSVRDRALPACVEAMRPGSGERIICATAHLHASEQAAVAAIYAAFPFLAGMVAAGTAKINAGRVEAEIEDLARAVCEHPSSSEDEDRSGRPILVCDDCGAVDDGLVERRRLARRVGAYGLTVGEL